MLQEHCALKYAAGTHWHINYTMITGHDAPITLDPGAAAPGARFWSKYPEKQYMSSSKTSYPMSCHIISYHNHIKLYFNIIIMIIIISNFISISYIRANR